jgi:hypothetical protein
VKPRIRLKTRGENESTQRLAIDRSLRMFTKKPLRSMPEINRRVDGRTGTAGHLGLGGPANLAGTVGEHAGIERLVKLAAKMISVTGSFASSSD